LCLDGSDTEECFKQNYLENDKGDVWMQIPRAHHGAETFRDNIKLPKGVNCDRCTLSWRWDTYSTQFDALKGEAPDKAAIRVNCADIAIIGDSEGGGNLTHDNFWISAASPAVASLSFFVTVVVMSTVLVMVGKA